MSQLQTARDIALGRAKTKQCVMYVVRNPVSGRYIVKRYPDAADGIIYTCYPDDRGARMFDRTNTPSLLRLQAI